MAATLAFLLAAGETQHAAAQSARDRLIDAPKQQLGERRDIIALRSGTHHEGSLQGCSAQACALGGRSFPRSQVFMIGLAVSASETLAPVADPSQDTVQLRNGTVVKGKVLGINAQAVVSELGSHPRAEVAFVLLAPPQRAPGSAQPRSTQPENTPTPPVSYVWQGRIEVENNYNGPNGTHSWTAKYQVKFLEEHTSERRSYKDSFIVYSIVPLELEYTIHARQDWDRGPFALHTNTAGEILGGDVRMHGQATGIILADRMKGYKFLSGDIGAIEAPADSASTNQRAFASDTEFGEFYSNYMTSPGWYHLNISFHGNSREQRALYDGINRRGQEPIRDADTDFLRWVPNYMPAGTNVIGRLDTPDQTDVRGEISAAVGGQGSDAKHVKVKWVFVRKRTQ